MSSPLGPNPQAAFDGPGAARDLQWALLARHPA